MSVYTEFWIQNVSVQNERTRPELQFHTNSGSLLEEHFKIMGKMYANFWLFWFCFDLHTLKSNLSLISKWKLIHMSLSLVFVLKHFTELIDMCVFEKVIICKLWERFFFILQAQALFAILIKPRILVHKYWNLFYQWCQMCI